MSDEERKKEEEKLSLAHFLSQAFSPLPFSGIPPLASFFRSASDLDPPGDEGSPRPYREKQGERTPSEEENLRRIRSPSSLSPSSINSFDNDGGPARLPADHRQLSEPGAWLSQGAESAE